MKKIIFVLSFFLLYSIQTTSFASPKTPDPQLTQAVKDYSLANFAAMNYKAGKPNYAGITMGILIQYGLLPSNIKTNPWQGAFTINANPVNPNQAELIMTQIPTDYCIQLQSLVLNGSGICYGNIFIYTLNA